MLLEQISITQASQDSCLNLNPSTATWNDLNLEWVGGGVH